MHTQGELLFGLRILFGVGKGSNNRYSIVLQNGVIVKYGAGGNGEPNRAVQNRIATCTQMAREIARKAWNETARALNVLRNPPQQARRGSVNFLLSSPQAVFSDILHDHFGIEPNNAGAIQYISNAYQKIYTGLSSHVIIAASSDPDQDDPYGYVNLKKLAKDSGSAISSPFRTVGMYDGDAKKIAQLQADQSALNARAQKYGVVATIPALFLRRSSSIHIDFKLVENTHSRRWTDLGIATIILHEASHKFDFTRDHAYCSEDQKYNALRSSQLLRNADSYTFAAASIHCNKLIADERDSAISGSHNT